MKRLRDLISVPTLLTFDKEGFRMPEEPDKRHTPGGLPKIQVTVKTPPSSGGLANWGPISQWVVDSLKHLFHHRK